jgi:FHS family Na+ dependent glucose MFS transporter 1
MLLRSRLWSSQDSREKLGKTTAYYASYIAIGFATGIVGPTLPGLAQHTGTALSEISFLFPTYSIGYLVGSFLSGHLFDRVKGHPVISAALFLLMVVMVLIPLTPIIWVIMGLFFMTGLATAGVDVGGNTLLIWIHGKSVGPFMVGLHFFFGLGALIAPMVVGLTIKVSGDIIWAYWILACISFPLMLLFLRLKSPEYTTRTVDEGSKGKNQLMVILISVFIFLHVGAELSYGGWIYSYAVNLNLASTTTAAYLTSLYWGSLTLARLISVLIALRMKTSNILLVDLAGCIFAVILLLAFPKSSHIAWIGTIILGFSIAALLPTSLTFAGENMDITGRVMRWFIIGIGVGNMFFPWLIGQFFETKGPSVMPLINLITFILALGLLINMLVLTRVKKKF